MSGADVRRPHGELQGAFCWLRRKGAICFVFAAATMLVCPVQVDAAVRVLLRDENVRRGEVTEQTQRRIKLETGDGNVFVYQIADIEKVIREVPTTIDVIHTTKGSVLKGKIVEESANRVKLQTQDGNIHALFIDEISSRVTESGIREESWVPSEGGSMDLLQTVEAMSNQKSPGLALVLSMFIIPGSGQFYNGQTGKGVAFLVTGLGGAILMGAGLSQATETDPRTGLTYTTGEGGGPLLLGVALALTSGIWGGIDAYKSAKRINRESLGRLGMRPRMHEGTPMVEVAYHF